MEKLRNIFYSWPYFLFVVFIILPINYSIYSDGRQLLAIILTAVQVLYVLSFIIDRRLRNRSFKI